MIDESAELFREVLPRECERLRLLGLRVVASPGSSAQCPVLLEVLLDRAGLVVADDLGGGSLGDDLSAESSRRGAWPGGAHRAVEDQGYLAGPAEVQVVADEAPSLPSSAPTRTPPGTPRSHCSRTALTSSNATTPATVNTTSASRF